MRNNKRPHLASPYNEKIGKGLFPVEGCSAYISACITNFAISSRLYVWFAEQKDFLEGILKELF